MGIKLPTLSDIISSVRSDIRKFLPNSDPSIFGSMIRAFSDSNAGRHFDNVLLIKQLEKELFPQTASGEALERWAGYEGITRFPSAGSQGNVTLTGLAPSTIPAGTSLSSADGNLYTTQTSVDITSISISITSLTRSGTTVTATTAASHQLATGVTATISGAVETDYNGAFDITVLSDTTFIYEIATTPTSPATGMILAAADIASVNVKSDEFGADKNLASGALLTLVVPIVGVDADGFVQITGLTGATDEETDSNLLARTLQSRESPVANFNAAAITKKALSVPGVTRVLVKKITPYIGAVTVLFVRDGDANIIPDAGEVASVKTAILEISPVNSAESDLFVTAPTPVTVNFVFSMLNPSTASMKTAVTANIEALFEDGVDFETDVTTDKYRSAIIDTVDPETGDQVSSFTLSSPAGDIAVATNEIAVLGTVTYP